MSVDLRPGAAFEVGLDVREVDERPHLLGRLREEEKGPRSVSGRHMMFIVGAQPPGLVRRRTELPSNS